MSDNLSSVVVTLLRYGLEHCLVKLYIIFTVIHRLMRRKIQKEDSVYILTVFSIHYTKVTKGYPPHWTRLSMVTCHFIVSVSSVRQMTFRYCDHSLLKGTTLKQAPV